MLQVKWAIVFPVIYGDDEMAVADSGYRGECGGGGSGDIKVDQCCTVIKRLLNGDLMIKLYVSMS